jgi:Ni2+-binding GTPase involved in maturation of urease and hydrogenase
VPFPFNYCDLGQQKRGAVVRVTCELVLVNKIDLLPHLDFDVDRFLYHLDAVHPGVPWMLVSARTGEGIEGWREWLAAAGDRGRAAV